MEKPNGTTHFLNGKFFKKSSFDNNFFVYINNNHFEGWIPAKLKITDNPSTLNEINYDPINTSKSSRA